MKTYSLQYWNTNAKAWWTIEDNIASLTDESEICVMEWQATRHAVISSATRFRIVEVIEKPVRGFKLRHAVTGNATRFRIVEVTEKPVSGFKLQP